MVGDFLGLAFGVECGVWPSFVTGIAFGGVVFFLLFGSLVRRAGNGLGGELRYSFVTKESLRVGLVAEGEASVGSESLVWLNQGVFGRWRVGLALGLVAIERECCWWWCKSGPLLSKGCVWCALLSEAWRWTGLNLEGDLMGRAASRAETGAVELVEGV